MINLNRKQLLSIICSILAILSVVLSISAMRKPFQKINYNGEIYKPLIYSDSIIYTHNVAASGYFEHFNPDTSVTKIHVLSIISEILLCFYIILILHNVYKPMREKYQTVDSASLIFPIVAFGFLIASSACSNSLNVDICEDVYPNQCVNFKLKSNHITKNLDGDTFNSYSKTSIGYNLMVASTVVSGLVLVANFVRFYFLKLRN